MILCIKQPRREKKKFEHLLASLAVSEGIFGSPAAMKTPLKLSPKGPETHICSCVLHQSMATMSGATTSG